MKKSFKISLFAALLIAAGTMIFAFSKPSQPEPTVKSKTTFAQFYRFDGTVCFPLTTPAQRTAAIAQLNNGNNWVPVGSLSCPGATCLCGIFVPDGTTLEEAIQILIDRINEEEVIGEDTYSDPDNPSKSVTVELKSA